MRKPERCGKCGAEPEGRKRWPHCGEAEWVLHHGADYMRGAREVIGCSCPSPHSALGCSCPSPHSALGRRKEAINERQATRVKAGKRADWNRPVSTQAMAHKAAEGLVRGLSPTQALREAAYPASTVNRSRAGINKIIRAELKNLGRNYIQFGRDLSPEEQEAMVRGRLAENTIIGSDKGVLSARQLGADKRVAMWQPDSHVGLVVLQAPPVPKIDHEVPIPPPVHPEEDLEVEDDSRSRHSTQLETSQRSG